MIKVLDFYFLDKSDIIVVFLAEILVGLILFEIGFYFIFSYLKVGFVVYGYWLEDIVYVFIIYIYLDYVGVVWVMVEVGVIIYLYFFGKVYMYDFFKFVAFVICIYGDDMEWLWSMMKGILVV